MTDELEEWIDEDLEEEYNEPEYPVYMSLDREHEWGVLVAARTRGRAKALVAYDVSCEFTEVRLRRVPGATWHLETADFPWIVAKQWWQQMGVNTDVSHWD